MKVYSKKPLGYTRKQAFLCPECFKGTDDKKSWSKVEIYPEERFICLGCGKIVEPFEIK